MKETGQGRGLSYNVFCLLYPQRPEFYYVAEIWGEGSGEDVNRIWGEP